ncbi:CBS domain-containing protein [Paucihalobacter ruber]|jgi:signal-transduction protein with cAMP-binding, CBS, and nucleotidyltransferase domain|uniref:CBS domain-containing protein n=1 Tax=Paucihalobacter ruber TaxID=2567861 RepID=A0A506PP88_9FLAO|nr:CBS domain-containing protein [Paucihalobacter ruber]TPV35524.1 CBS domain-containing protein [Paucihalobacter ruber]
MSDYKSAKEIASKSLYYIDGLASAREAIDKMKQHGVDTLIIKKRNEQDANGILVVADIVRGVILPDLSLDEVSVYEIMSKPVISVPATLNARYVPRLLAKAKINVAPVEENGNYIGIVHLRDILFSL